MVSSLLSSAVSLLVLAVIGSWLVIQADHTLALSRTCRYRDFDRLQQKAERLSLTYAATAFTGLLWYPGGLLVTFWVLGFALYRRLRRMPLNF
jgi:hypothetical protein